MPLPIPLEPPTTRICFPPKSSSFIVTPKLFGGEKHSSWCLREERMSEFKKLSRSVAGLTVLVTGAASGMGRATARVFAAEGANVAVTDYAAEGAQAVAAEIAAGGGSGKAWRLDVADRDDIEAVVNDVAAHFGGLDVVVNNAGISVRVAIDEDAY